MRGNFDNHKTQINKYAKLAASLVGVRIGRWTVTALAKKRGDKHMVRVRCDCGKERVVPRYYLTRRRRPSRSCGCLKIEEFAERARVTIVHGDARKGAVTVEWNTWSSMKRRCENPNAENYNRYGGRGIKVCARWQNSFENFLSDMGRKPSPQHSIDRIDNDGNYEPGNCRWATKFEQVHNRRRKEAA